MFTFVRRLNLIEPNFRACIKLINVQVNSFSSQHTPHAVKRKKAKAKDSTVSNFSNSLLRSFNSI